MDTALGIDFGNTRIGLALGKNGTCTPLTIIQGKNWDTALFDIKKIIDKNYISLVVLGITKQNNLTIKKFHGFLKENLNTKIELWDESFTSKEALEYAIKMGYSKKSRKYIDNISACVILERYFESNL